MVSKDVAQHCLLKTQAHLTDGSNAFSSQETYCKENIASKDCYLCGFISLFQVLPVYHLANYV